MSEDLYVFIDDPKFDKTKKYKVISYRKFPDRKTGKEIEQYQVKLGQGYETALVEVSKCRKA